MRFPYHEIEDDTLESMGNITSGAGSTNGDIMVDDDRMFCPTRPLLPYWPQIAGWCQIVVGLLCAGFGAVEVFAIWYTVSQDVGWELSWLNSFGMAIYSGILLVISGSLAVRASWNRNMMAVRQFYVITFLSFLINLGMMVGILVCKISLQITQFSKCNGSYTDTLLKMICENQHKVESYIWVVVLSAVWCLLGCLLLFLTTVNYFIPVLFGEVHLLKGMTVCCLPCFFYHPPKETLNPYTQEQKVTA